MLTLRDAPEHEQFRHEVRTWAGANIPQTLRWRDDYDSLLAVDQLLAEHNMLAASWPEEFGGQGLPPICDAILAEELGRAGVQRARSPSHQGVNNLGPAVIVHGTPQQKNHILRGILSVQDIWCQGFSEPDAGSDLASLRTTARTVDDHYVVNGSKIWTSNAEHASHMYALVRTGTSESRHRGLTFVFFPMSTPGVSVRPIVQITGESDFSQVFLDDVSVPRESVVGAAGEGWRVAMTLLGSERLSGRHRYALFREELVRLIKWGSEDISPGALDPRIAGELIARLEGMGSLARRIESLLASSGNLGALPSVNKLWWPALHQQMSEQGLELANRRREDPSAWYQAWLASRPESIYGGSAQIQRNIIAERYLGLPR